MSIHPIIQIRIKHIFQDSVLRSEVDTAWKNILLATDILLHTLNSVYTNHPPTHIHIPNLELDVNSLKAIVTTDKPTWRKTPAKIPK